MAKGKGKKGAQKEAAGAAPEPPPPELAQLEDSTAEAADSKRGFFSRMFGGAESARAEELVAELEGLRADVLTLDQQLGALKVTHAEVLEDKHVVERKLLSVSQHAQTVAKEHAELNQRQSALLKRVAALEATADSLAEQLEASNEETKRARDKLKVERQRNNVLLRKQADDAKAHERLTEQVKTLEASGREAKQATERAEELSQRVEEMSRERETAAATTKALEKRVEALSTELDTLRAERQAIADDAKGQAAKRKALEKKLAERDKDVANLKALASEARAERERADAHATSLEGSLSSLRSKLDQEVARRSEHDDETATLRREHESVVQLVSLLGHGTACLLDDIFGAKSALAWRRWGEAARAGGAAKEVLDAALAGLGVALEAEADGFALRIAGEGETGGAERAAAWLSFVAAGILSDGERELAPGASRMATDGGLTVHIEPVNGTT